MSEISHLEARLRHALERLSQVPERIAAQHAGGEGSAAGALAQSRAQADELQAMLEAARAELADHDAQTQAVAQLREDLAARDAELEQLRAAVADHDADKKSAEHSAALIADLQAQLQARDATAAGTDPDQANQADLISALEDALAKERRLVADLREGLQAQPAGAPVEHIAQLEQAANRMKHVNAELRATSAQMRQALADELGDAEMINRAMEAELDALSAARDLEASEVSSIISQLQPIVEGSS